MTFQDTLPDACDVVVIGAGVIGTATAYYLARQGQSVLLCDKGRVAGEQSSRNWGWVRQQGRDPSELPLMMESLKLWKGLAEEIGEDVGFQQTGCLYLSETPEIQQSNIEWLEAVKEFQLDSKLLSAREVGEILTDSPEQWKGGAIYTASDGRAEPWIAVPALARAAQRAGARIIENCAVRTLEETAGQVSGVVTEKGRVRCSRVVLAAGAWTSLFAANLGIKIPQLSVRSTVAQTAPAPNILNGQAASSKIAIRRRADDGYSVALCDFSEHFVGPDSFRNFKLFLPSLKAAWHEVKVRLGSQAFLKDLHGPRSWGADDITPFEKTRVLNPPPSDKALSLMKERLAATWPQLAGIELRERWAGMIESTPDILPILGESDQQSGLILATGLSGHGFGIGLGVGKLLADVAQGKPAPHDISRFRLSRFYDGSPIELGPAL
ncbi:NAD(P)/FAD-dependent oxidoreductase [Rhodovibrionaceae bacterium A322]